MKVIGLTGSIASGKTQVTDLLRSKGAFVICADELSREAVLPGMEGYRSIVETFGREFLNADGTLDRRKLAGHVFHDDAARTKLEQILHPIIKKAVIEKLTASGERIAVVSAPLLIEAGWGDWMDELWLVVAEDGQRLQRLMKRDGLSEKDAKARMKAQMPQEEKKKHAHVLIDNSGRIEDTLNLADRLWKRINL